MLTVVNRAPVPLNARFDGQDIELPPGESQLPAVAVIHAKNQNPIMGTADPLNPSISGAKYLVGVKGTKDNCKPLTKAEWEAHLGQPCRMDWETLVGERLGPHEKVIFRGKGRTTQAKSSFDTGVRVGAPEVIADAR